MRRVLPGRPAVAILAILVHASTAMADPHGATPHAGPSHDMPAAIEPLSVEDDAGTLSQALRTLGAVQARIVAGHADPSEQAASLRQIADMLPAQASAVWSRSRNARRLALFLFNGGEAAAVRAALATADVPAPDKPLIEGALAYSDGRLAEARVALMPIDPRALPAEIGAHLALVQAALLAAEDASAALQRLDLARLLLPGSLVEEAALRRSTFLLGEVAPRPVLAEVVRRYRLRYGASAYAANFERRVRATVLDRWIHADPPARILLAGMAQPLSPDDSAALWLAIARRALVASRPDLVREAVALAPARSLLALESRQRADLYLTVAALFAPADAPVSKRLAALDGQLAPGDREFWRASMLIAANIEAPMPKPAVGGGVAEHSASVSAMMARAQDVLAQARP